MNVPSLLSLGTQVEVCRDVAYARFNGVHAGSEKKLLVTYAGLAVTVYPGGATRALAQVAVSRLDELDPVPQEVDT
jgi:hypothetical protein